MHKSVEQFSVDMSAPITVRVIGAYLTVGFFVALQFVLQGSVSLMVPELKTDLNIHEAGVGLLSSVFFYPYVLLQVPSGWILSRTGIRALLTVSGVLMSLGCLLQSGADTYNQMMIGRVVMGIGAAPGIVCFLKTVEISFPPVCFGILAAGMEVFGMVGAGIGDFLIPESIHIWGWRSALKFFAILSLLPVLGALLLITRKKKRQGCSESRPVSGAWKNVFYRKDVWLVALFCGLMFAIINAFAALWAIPFLETSPDCVGQAGRMAAMIYLGAAVGAPALGWLADHGMDSRKAMMTGGTLSIVVLMAILSGRLPPVFYYPMMFFLGLGASTYMLPFVLVKHWLKGEELSIGLAFTNAMSVMVGALLYQPLIGWLIGFYQEACMENYREVLMILPAGVLIACMLVISMRKCGDGP
ncbi:MFS transporter [Sansalvadorimonas verongulae]|uniref:MFS transporter n=1 Tax=Sansalvadorimonas verongulae TaxID=2172824 RepID=UPI0012BB672D|nr:MFS transporter [Sansalvadorimonas verongulae]MTI13105.1 MFS transporter [Sansalvadorimonas verongulae]